MKKVIIAFAVIMMFATCGNQSSNGVITIDSTNVVKDTTVNVGGGSDTTTSGGSKDNELIIK